jgi:RecB family endonuclease NucS
LENLIAINIESVISEDSLMTIFQERKSKEEPDILALDRKGDMSILELKRWESDPENLLQVLRYGQIFGQYNYEMLNNLFRKHKKDSLVELLEEHKKYFDLRREEELRENEINRKQHFLIITDGTDTR